jgi:hypothetical protein
VRDAGEFVAAPESAAQFFFTLPIFSAVGLIHEIPAQEKRRSGVSVKRIRLCHFPQLSIPHIHATKLKERFSHA